MQRAAFVLTLLAAHLTGATPATQPPHSNQPAAATGDRPRRSRTAPTASYNMIFERLIHCNNAATLEAMFLRLWHVAEQRDRATIYAHRRTQA